jgi:hypothetical protein
MEAYPRPRAPALTIAMTVAIPTIAITAPAYTYVPGSAHAPMIANTAHTRLKNLYITIFQHFPFYKLCSLNNRANACSCLKSIAHENNTTAGLPDYSWSKHTKTEKVYQMTTNSTERPYTI